MGKNNALMFRKTRSNVYKWQIAVGVLMAAVAIITIILAFALPNRTYPRPFYTDFNLVSNFVFNIELIWLVFVSAGISAIAHFFIAFSKRSLNSYAKNLCYAGPAGMAQGVNMARWRIYAITHTLLIWVVLQLAGITNIFYAFLILGAWVVLQYLAYVHEGINSCVENRRLISMTPFWLGVFTWLLVWVPILIYLFSTASLVNIPTYAYVVTIGAGVVTLAMGVIAFLRYLRLADAFKKNLVVENTYNVLDILITVVVALPLWILWM